MYETHKKHPKDKRRKVIRTLLRMLLVMAFVLWLNNNPPKRTEAAPVNKQVVQETLTDTVVNVEPPQAVVIPQPESWPKGCEHYVAEVQKYAWNVSVAVNVMRAESGCNPTAIGDNYPINGLHAASCGLYQVRTLTGRPDCETLKNPATNIQWAWRVYQSQGWSAWSVCRTKVSCY